MKTNDSRIVKVSEWMKVSSLTASTAKWAELDSANTCTGVYQVALKDDAESIGDNLIHEDICYTGESGRIHSRTYAIRQPNGTHGASRFIRHNGLDTTKIMIRYCYTNSDTLDHKTLENEIHTTSTKMFGKRFKWKEASAGNDGRYQTTIDNCRTFSTEELISLKNEIEELFFAASQREAVERWNEA